MGKLVIFKLGSEQKGFIPSSKMFRQFKRDLAECLKNDTGVLVTHPFLTVNVVDIPAGAKAVVTDDDEHYDSLENSIRRIWDEDAANRIEVITKETDRILAENRRKLPWYKRLFV